MTSLRPCTSTCSTPTTKRLSVSSRCHSSCITPARAHIIQHSVYVYMQHSCEANDVSFKPQKKSPEANKEKAEQFRNRRDWETSWEEEETREQVGEGWTIARDRGSQKCVHKQTNTRDTEYMRRKTQRHRHALNQDDKVHTQAYTSAYARMVPRNTKICAHSVISVCKPFL